MRPNTALGPLAALSLLLAGCAASPRPFPWPASAQPSLITDDGVTTLVPNYDRRRSRVLVRRITRPTRANLDFAAYFQNAMVADAPPEVMPSPGLAAVDLDAIFGGVIDTASIVTAAARMPLSAGERRAPLALPPLVDQIARWKTAAATSLEDIRDGIEGEIWGAAGPHVNRQWPSLAFVHQPPKGPAELWLRIEFAPWFADFAGMPDSDGDGCAEIYARVRPGLVPPEVFDYIAAEYAGRALDAHEIATWANEITSAWYPSYNTDLIDAGARWPDASTDATAVATLHGQTFAQPTVVMVGKPQGEAIYTALIVDGIATAAPRTAGSVIAGPHTGVTASPGALAARIVRELATHGGTWDAWSARVEPLHREVRALLAARDPDLGALVGRDGFLFFGKSLEQMVGGDLRAQPAGKDPFVAIVEFKEMLAEQNVDFLFVPIPTKAAIFSDAVAAAGVPFAGEIVTPYERKLLLELSRAGVEIVDLLPAFLAARKDKAEEEIYLAQDTHWTDRGLRIAARLLAERVARYPWYAALAAEPIPYTTERVTFTEAGDLPSRLAPNERQPFPPQTLVGHRVLTPQGAPYDDDPRSPITILGDSFTGVYERTFCRNAGLSAHLAKNLGVPIDLVMSYGGGPNVRRRFLRRGTDALAGKRLVIWAMAARDLYNYWEDWELLGAP